MGLLNKASLSASRRRLVETMQEMKFGVVENLRIRGGEPLWHPPPRIVRVRKLCGENSSKAARGTQDYALKDSLTELFRQMDELGNGTIAQIEVKYGLPFVMRTVEGD